MSNISKQIVSAILSENFYKAKELISEALNGKLGVLMEEKLISFGPTIHSPSNKLFEDDADAAKWRRKVQDQMDRQSKIPPDVLDSHPAGNMPAGSVHLGNPILRDSTSFDQALVFGGGGVAGLGMKLLKSPNLGLKVVGASLIAAGLTPAGLDIWNTFNTGQESGSTASERTGTFATQSAMGALDSPQTPVPTVRETILAQDRSTTNPNDSERGVLAARIAQTLLTTLSGVGVGSSVGKKVGTILDVQNATKKFELRKADLEKQYVDNKVKFEGNPEKLKANDADHKEKMNDLNTNYNPAAIIPVATKPVDFPSNIPGMVVSAVKQVPLVVGAGSIAFPNFARDIAIATGAGTKTLTSREDLNALRQIRFTDEAAEDLRKLAYKGRRLQLTNGGNPSPGFRWTQAKNGDWILPSGRVATQADADAFRATFNDVTNPK